MKRVDSQHEFESLVLKLKWLLMFIDGLIFLIALGCFGICLWIRFDLDFMIWVPLMNWYSYWYCMYVVMLGMVISIPTVLLHLYGMLTERVSMFGYVLGINVVTIIIEIIGFIVILIYGIEDSIVLHDELRKVFFGLVYRYDYDENASKVLKMIQEWVKCCGARGAEDYHEALKPMPYECRDHVTGHEYRYGCAQKMAWYVEPWTAILASSCLALIILQIVQMVASSKLSNRLRQYKRTADYEYD